MYKVVYYASHGREASVSAASYSRAMDKASNLAIKQVRPPFPIIIQDDEGRIIQTIHG
jgi:hypothetical protein